MTSTALPPFYPPWEVDGVLYLDGGVTSHLPLQAAVARGAHEIFALRNGHGFMLGSAPVQRNVFSIGSKAISLLVERQAALGIEAVQPVYVGSNADVLIHSLSERMWSNAYFCVFKRPRD
jgi:predicted acylesterase/phospholipase RssA